MLPKMLLLVVLQTSCTDDNDCGITSYCASGTCRCLAGYFGESCNLTENQCNGQFCNAEGTCVFVDDLQLCNCTNENYGPDCNETEDECKLTCFNGALCNSIGGCVCVEGSHLDPIERCETCIDGYAMVGNTCYLETCVNDEKMCSTHGLCTENGTCVCESGYYGKFCEINQLECDETSCRSSGVCTAAINSSCPVEILQGFSCRCNELFDGCNCENCVNGFTLIGDECVSILCVQQGSSSVCSSAGSCVDEGCICTANHYGQFCEASLEECNSVYCYSNGVCNFEDFGRETCNCTHNYDPEQLCSTCLPDFKEISGECVPVSCTNDGERICSGLGSCDEGICICNTTFGVFCELSAEECGEINCNGNGDCIVSGCSCYPDYEGEECERCRYSELIQIDGKCYHRNCVKDDIVCSYQGECINNQCKCLPERFGLLCQMSTLDCMKENCNGHGICVAAETGEIQCNCSEGWISAACLTCDTTNQYVILGQDCVKISCIENGSVCGSIGTCVEGACVCDGAFGAFCEMTQKQCDLQICGGAGSCVESGRNIKCQCGGKLRAECCRFGYASNGCLALGSLLAAIIISVAVIVIVFLLLLWNYSERKLRAVERRRNVEKHYIDGMLKATKQGRNFFMV